MKAIAIFGFTLLFVAAHTLSTSDAGWDPDKRDKVTETIAAFKKKDPELKVFFTEAYGYAVFPSIIKGGAFGLGGAHGKGKVFERKLLIGTTSLSQGTVGFQLGGQSYSQIIFFKDKTALDRFRNGNLKFAAQASAIAATAGASRSAAYSNGVAVFTLPKKGLMYEASIGGQSFSFKPISKESAAK